MPLRNVMLYDTTWHTERNTYRRHRNVLRSSHKHSYTHATKPNLSLALAPPGSGRKENSCHYWKPPPTPSSDWYVITFCHFLFCLSRFVSLLCVVNWMVCELFGELCADGLWSWSVLQIKMRLLWKTILWILRRCADSWESFSLPFIYTLFDFYNKVRV